MRRAGRRSRKLPAKTSSTSWHSAGEALSTATARGRLLPAATTMILLPLPRRPDREAPFWRSRRWHPRTLRPDSVGPARVIGCPGVAAPLPTCRCAPVAETVGGRSGTADIAPAAPAIARPFLAPTRLRSAPRACHARGVPDHRYAAVAAAPVPPRPTVPR